MSDKPTETEGRVQRDARLEWIPLAAMHVSPVAQRQLQQDRVDKLVAAFDLEKLGTLTVNWRSECWWLIDGQHRAEALRQLGYGDQQVECWTYRGLNEGEEAEKFLGLNDILAVGVFPRFKVAVAAGRPVETDINKIVQGLGLRVSMDSGQHSVRAVGTLRRVYLRGGPQVLRRSLGIIRDSYGDSGLEALVIDGVALVCERYDGDLTDDRAATALSSGRGGVSSLLGRAETLRLQTGNTKAHCVAAAVVEQVNSGRGGKRLPTWWKATAGDVDGGPR